MSELEAMHELREEFRSSLDVVARDLMKQKYELCVNTDEATQGITSMYQKFSSLETIAIKMQSRLESLEQEMQEQARIIGMGGECELALVAKVESLEKDAARAKVLSGAVFGVLEGCNIQHSTRKALEMAYFSDVDVFAIDTAMQANKGE